MFRIHRIILGVLLCVVGSASAVWGQIELLDTVMPPPVRDFRQLLPQSFTGETVRQNGLDHSITLEWTAPYGYFESYDIRMIRTSDIADPKIGVTEKDFEKQPILQGVPAPKKEGRKQSITVTGLTPATGYVFGIRTVNSAATSSLVVSGAMTFDAPSHSSGPRGAPVISIRKPFEGQVFGESDGDTFELEFVVRDDVTPPEQLEVKAYANEVSQIFTQSEEKYSAVVPFPTTSGTIAITITAKDADGKIGTEKFKIENK